MPPPLQRPADPVGREKRRSLPAPQLAHRLRHSLHFAALAAICAIPAGCSEPQTKPSADRPPPAGAEERPVWTEIRNTQGTRFFLTQPKKVGQSTHVWLASISEKPDETGAVESSTLFAIDCSQTRMRVVEENGYDKSGGRLDLAPRDAEHWYYPSPDMVAFKVSEMACGSRPITGPGFASISEASKAKPTPPHEK